MPHGLWAWGVLSASTACMPPCQLPTCLHTMAPLHPVHPVAVASRHPCTGGHSLRPRSSVVCHTESCWGGMHHVPVATCFSWWALPTSIAPSPHMPCAPQPQLASNLCTGDVVHHRAAAGCHVGNKGCPTLRLHAAASRRSHTGSSCSTLQPHATPPPMPSAPCCCSWQSLPTGGMACRHQV